MKNEKLREDGKRHINSKTTKNVYCVWRICSAERTSLCLDVCVENMCRSMSGSGQLRRSRLQSSVSSSDQP